MNETKLLKQEGHSSLFEVRCPEIPNIEEYITELNLIGLAPKYGSDVELILHLRKGIEGEPDINMSDAKTLEIFTYTRNGEVILELTVDIDERYTCLTQTLRYDIDDKSEVYRIAGNVSKIIYH